MKKVININFQGRVVPIEETSYDLLKQYTDSLRLYFANEEGREEIINDIESRIGELFQEKIKNGATCITDDDINAIINNIGRPQELADAESAASDSGFSNQNKNSQSDYKNSQSDYQHTAFTTGGKRLYRDENHKILGGVCSGLAAYFNIEPIIIRLVFIFSGIGFFAYILMWAFVPGSHSVQNGVRKRLYRNPDNKFIAGVCSGIASYFNINVWIPRIIFLIPFVSFFFHWRHFGFWNFPHFFDFSFSPTTALIYVIFWLVIPEASSTSEKLEMKGEKVDLNSIKKSVVEEMKGVKERITVAGREGAEFGKRFGAEVGSAARRGRTSLGDIIIVLLKIFLYFLLAIFAFTSFGFAIAATGLFPFKDYIIKEGWQNFFAWGTLILFIYVPVIGVITWVIRRIAKIKSNSKTIRWGVILLWTAGWVCFICLIASVSKDFRRLNTVTDEKITLTNPGVNMLEISANGMGKYNRFRIEPFSYITEDTAYVDNVSIRIIKSTNDSFQVSVTRFCNGRTRNYADTLAARMNYVIAQRDSTLIIPKGIPITEDDKFRNQHIIITIAVPVGKRIMIDKKVGWGSWERFQFPWSNVGDDYDWDSESYSWNNHQGEELQMQESGLYTMDGKSTNTGRNFKRTILRKNGRRIDITVDDNENNTDDNGNDNTNGYRYDQTQKTIDSLKKINDVQKQKLKDSLNKVREQINKKIEKLEDKAPKQEAYLPLSEAKYDFVLHI